MHTRPQRTLARRAISRRASRHPRTPRNLSRQPHGTLARLTRLARTSRTLSRTGTPAHASTRAHSAPSHAAQSHGAPHGPSCATQSHGTLAHRQAPHTHPHAPTAHPRAPRNLTATSRALRAHPRAPARPAHASTRAHSAPSHAAQSHGAPHGTLARRAISRQSHDTLAARPARPPHACQIPLTILSLLSTLTRVPMGSCGAGFSSS